MLHVCSSDDKNILKSTTTLVGLYKVSKEVILVFNFSLSMSSVFLKNFNPLMRKFTIFHLEMSLKQLIFSSLYHI